MIKEILKDGVIYRTGQYQSCLDIWYMVYDGPQPRFITKKEFQDAIDYTKPELDPLPDELWK